MIAIGVMHVLRHASHMRREAVRSHPMRAADIDARRPRGRHAVTCRGRFLARGRDGLVVWTSIEDDALRFGSSAEAHAFMAERLSGAAIVTELRA